MEVKNPKELLEKFDTVEIVGFAKESENGEHVVIDNKLIDARGKGWVEIKNLTDNLEYKFTNSNIHAVKITDKNGNVKWEREPKSHEVGNHVKWHEALLMAASGTPMHGGDYMNDYMALNENNELSWYSKKTNDETQVLSVYKATHWAEKWAPYTPKKMVVDWTKVPVDTEVWVTDKESEASILKKFKCFVDGNVYVQSSANKDVLIKYKFTELAEPNDDYMKETE